MSDNMLGDILADIASAAPTPAASEPFVPVPVQVITADQFAALVMVERAGTFPTAELLDGQAATWAATYPDWDGKAWTNAVTWGPAGKACQYRPVNVVSA